MNTNDIRILLVDDEPDILEIVGYNLKSEGYQVYTANNGIEGVKIAKKIQGKKVINYVLGKIWPPLDWLFLE